MTIAERALSAMRGAEIPMSFPLGRAWHVVTTSPRTEFSVERELLNLGFDAYTPRAKFRKILRGHVSHEERALFVGYVFAMFDVEREEWFGPITETDGVRGILSNNQIPCRVSAGEIERLRRAQLAGVFDLTHPGASFAEGSAVRIEEGPFSGFIAKVKSATAKKRVKVLLEFLGGRTEVEIDPSQLSAA